MGAAVSGSAVQSYSGLRRQPLGPIFWLGGGLVVVRAFAPSAKGNRCVVGVTVMFQEQPMPSASGLTSNRPYTMTWIFGYGSLVYKPGFDYSRKVHGCIRGWRRVWWQGSTDHRGTPEAPGRTVTLVEDPGAVTWGVAYELPGSPEQQAVTIAYLEWREKQYDRRCLVDFFPAAADWPAAGNQHQRQQQEPHQQQELQQQELQQQQQQQQPQDTAGVIPGCLVYVATDSPANRNYLGPARLAEIAAQIAGAAGPSGPNHEYLGRLAAAMREMQVDDPELFELEALVQQAMAGTSSSGSVGSSGVADGTEAAAAAAAAAGAVAAAAAATCAVQQGVAAGAVQQTAQLLAAAAAARRPAPPPSS